MSGGNLKRTRTVTIRMTEENFAAAGLVGSLTGRTVSSLTEYALELFIRKNFPLAYVSGAKLELSLHEAPEHTGGG